MGGRHATEPAEAGALVSAAVGVTMTSAASWRPRSSVTVRRTVNDPDAGATTIAVSVFSPRIPGAPPLTMLQKYVLMTRPHAAPLPLPCNCTFCPGDTLPGTLTAATGRSAACTAPCAFAIPAPQVSVVHTHSETCTSPDPVGTWHTGTVGSLEVGNGFLAPSLRREISCVVDSRPFAASISPEMPDTIGAEKLVPTLTWYWLVYVSIVGVVVPRLLVVSIEYRHGSPGPTFTQLPPGALNATPGPRLLKPTLVPTCRIAPMPATPAQLAGVSTMLPSLPTEATTSTPRARRRSIASW